MSKIDELINMLNAEVQARIAEDKRPLLTEIFTEALRKTDEEIRNGVDPRVFQTLVIGNFLILAAADPNLDAQTIKDFVSELTEETEEL